ncbi:hypothetical protein EYF80_001144 [Liparis tanakae]|uniref:Uncharacterized protein n=1 Tax=Liparis tanakae TaxID=230148 RepID=A0A4Z2JGK0_9TELE|nr:hypothetical protein EYF80_001144 [Liparis tanakae]
MHIPLPRFQRQVFSGALGRRWVMVRRESVVMDGVGVFTAQRLPPAVKALARPSLLSSDARPSVLSSDPRPSLLSSDARPSLLSSDPRPSVLSSDARPLVVWPFNRNPRGYRTQRDVTLPYALNLWRTVPGREAGSGPRGAASPPAMFQARSSLPVGEHSSHRGRGSLRLTLVASWFTCRRPEDAAAASVTRQSGTREELEADVALLVLLHVLQQEAVLGQLPVGQHVLQLGSDRGAQQRSVTGCFTSGTSSAPLPLLSLRGAQLQPADRTSGQREDGRGLQSDSGRLFSVSLFPSGRSSAVECEGLDAAGF